MEKYGIGEKHYLIKYVYSLYFGVVTITTIGYGDITPSNWIECLFLIIALLISSSLYAYLINSIGNLMENIKLASKLLI